MGDVWWCPQPPYMTQILVLTLLLPRALLEMLESLLATISTSLAEIPMQVELSSPERQLQGGVHKLNSCSPKVSMGRVGIRRGYNHHRAGVQSQYTVLGALVPRTIAPLLTSFLGNAK